MLGASPILTSSDFEQFRQRLFPRQNPDTVLNLRMSCEHSGCEMPDFDILEEIAHVEVIAFGKRIKQGPKSRLSPLFRAVFALTYC
jgi:hypothetical protein